MTLICQRIRVKSYVSEIFNAYRVTLKDVFERASTFSVNGVDFQYINMGRNISMLFYRKENDLSEVLSGILLENTIN